jgi:hypothetical protein
MKEWHHPDSERAQLRGVEKSKTKKTFVITLLRGFDVWQLD